MNATRAQALSDQIKDHLLDQILKGELEPGARLVELQIAKAMQTSQAPVREALKDLAALGVIEIRRNRGAVVRKIDGVELAEIYDVRAEIEGYAAELTALKAPETGVDLLHLCTEMETATANGDLTKFSRMNDAFHGEIVTRSGNTTLLRIWERLDVRRRTAINLHRQAPDFELIHIEHRTVATAINAGDGEAARKTLARHLRRVTTG